MTASPNRSIELFFVFLMAVGLALEAVSLYIDFTDPSFYLVLDLEIAGIVLIFFGFIADAIYTHF